MSKAEERIKAAIHAERVKFIQAKIPISRDEMNDLDQALMKMFMEAKSYQMTITVLPPGYDSEFGGYTVSLAHMRGTVTGGGVHLYDAIYMAQAKLKDLLESQEIKVVTVSTADIFTPSTSAKDIML